MIGAYFPVKYGLDRSDTQDMEEEWATQRARLSESGLSKTSVNTNHAAPMANGPNVSKLISHGILERSGLQEQSLG